jgi:hypothetical protein
MFGFTNDKTVYDRVVKFKQDAIADGWQARPTYEGHESIDRVCSLQKDDWKMMVLTRTDTGKWLFEADITIWAPDGLVIVPPLEYDWQAIQQRVNHCNACGKGNIKTHRYSFAGRCCEDCLPAMRKEHEYSGWTK